MPLHTKSRQGLGSDSGIGFGSALAFGFASGRGRNRDRQGAAPLAPLAKLLAAATLFAALTQAQSLTGIQSGFVYDATAKAIRPVNGLPGASTLGDPLDFGSSLPFDQVEFSTTHKRAYASVANQFYKLNLITNIAEPVETSLTNARLIAPGLLWSPDTRQVQFTESATQTFVASDGALTAAILKSGCAILAFDAGTVESICGNTQTQLFNDATAKIISLASTTASVYALDANSNQVLELSQTPTPIAAGFQQPVGLAAVSETQLAVADAGTQTLNFISLNATPAAPAISLLFAPTSLRHMDSNILQLGDAGAKPFEVIDLNQQNRNFFIPAIAIAKGDN